MSVFIVNFLFCLVVFILFLFFPLYTSFFIFLCSLIVICCLIACSPTMKKKCQSSLFSIDVIIGSTSLTCALTEFNFIILLCFLFFYIFAFQLKKLLNLKSFHVVREFLSKRECRFYFFNILCGQWWCFNENEEVYI